MKRRMMDRSGRRPVAAATASLAVALAIAVPASAAASPGPTPHGRTVAHKPSEVLKTTARPREFAGLASVSCTTQANCVTVGTSGLAGGSVAVSVHWDGTAWAELPAAPRIVPGLSQVACAGDSTCMAIDNQGRLLEWDGSTWHLPSGFTDGLLNGVLTGVSCASPVSCVAVGLGGIGNSTIAWAWNGQTWTEHDPVLPPGAEHAPLYGVSCVSASDCIAVGGSSALVQGQLVLMPLAEQWNGQSWSVLSVPGPTVAVMTIKLASVSCAGAASCVAVGDMDVNGTDQGLAYAWDGTSWTATPQPIGIPARVSCWSASGCVTTDQVGFQAGGTAIPELWNGSSWAQLHPPLPNTQFAEFNDVSCYGQAACLFIGTAGDERPLGLWWANGGWQLDRVVPRDGFAGISCGGPFACVGVGGYIDTSDDNATLTANLGGSGWQLAATPNVSGTLTDISCDSRQDCVAVGGRGPRDLPLAEKWDGHGWQVLDTSFGNSVTGTQPIAVSCANRHCLAVTRSFYAEWWNGSTWRLIRNVPIPRSGFAQLTDVSCASASYCLVAGELHPARGPFTSFADRWNGKSLRLLRVPGNGLTSISCLSVRFCLGVTVNSAVTWNGSSWRARSLPGIFGRPGLVAVSCSLERFCMAVGDHVAEGTVGNTIAFLKGSTWRILPSLPPDAVLTDVSCWGSFTNCVVAGEMYDGAAATRTFSAAWTGREWLLFGGPNP